MSAPSSSSVTVSVPATTANLGPGFDTLGIALDLHNQVMVRQKEGGGVDLLGDAGDNPSAVAMVEASVQAFFEKTALPSQGIQIGVTGGVPVSRGLGSSVTIRLGIVFGLNQLHNEPLTHQDMLEMVTALEGHPDNCAPALFGGFVASGQVNKGVQHCRFAVPPSVKFVACVPEFTVSTSQARTLLPEHVSLGDAVGNLNRVALITAAFASEAYDQLPGLFVDALHQPYRKALLPQLDEVITDGVAAGALGGWLSGSGSTIICITTEHEAAVAGAMAAVFERSQIPAQSLILTADNRGTRVADG